MDRWDGGNDYDLFMGRWSRAVASEFVAGLAQDRCLRWLDVGCGTGALTDVIISDAEPSAVAGVDPSAHFIEAAVQRLGEQVDLRISGGGQLPFADGAFDVVVSGIALNFIPDPVGALEEWKRVVRPDGVVGVYVWDYADGMEFLRVFWDTVLDLDPPAMDLDEGRRFPICEPDALLAAFDEAGFANPITSSIEVATCFGSFDDYWRPFLAGQGPAPTYVANLDPSSREVLRQRLRQALEADGSIELTARAWVVEATA